MVAIIIAGGKGTRLSSVTQNEIPKPMVCLNGKPVLEYQVQLLKNYGVQKIYFIIGYLGNIIEEYFQDGSAFGVPIEYIREPEPLGTGGGLVYLHNKIKDDVVFMYGDLLVDYSIKRMYNFHKMHNAYITLFAHPNSHPHDSDIVETDQDNRVINWLGKKEDRDFFYHNNVNAGVYIISAAYFDRDLDVKIEKIDFEKDILIPCINTERIYAYTSSEYIKDIGTPERLKETEEELLIGAVQARNLDNPQKCFFLDRDGTINKYKGLIYENGKLELEKNVSEALKLIHKKGYLAIIVTNQPVVARGLCEVEDVVQINNELETLLGREGAYVDGLVFCPHHPDRGYPEENKKYKIVCKCRKPNTGMIEQCIETFHIDKSKSWMIGDTTVDIQTGSNAGIRTGLVKTGISGKDGKFNVKPDKVSETLLELIWLCIQEDEKGR